MKSVVYNGLVRNNIPEIINKSGDKSGFAILNEADYAKALAEKLAAQQQEFLNAFEQEEDERAVFELADVVEVCYALLELIGVSMSDFEKIRQNINKEKGKFNSYITLNNVISEIEEEHE